MLRKENSQQKFALSDDQTELYIQAFFKVSPRRNNGTAPAYEWLQFLDLYNEREGHYILNPQQMNTIRPYCEANSQIELTPEDFIRLLSLIRHNQLESQPRLRSISRPVSATKKNDYFDVLGRSSPNHPSVTDNSSAKSVYEEEQEFLPRHNYTDYPSADFIATLQKSNLIATKQVKECESRMLTMAKEHSERISQLQTRLEYMNIEAEQQKSLVLQQKRKERERLDKINELQANLDELESQTAKKQEEVQNLRLEFTAMHENLQLAESKLQQLETEKSELHQENKKLIEIIDRQKFDLDEARTGYSTTESNEAQEQLIAEYSKKIQELESERTQYHQQTIEQQEIISSLSTEFNKQHEIIHTIQEDIVHFPRHKSVTVISIIAWIFLFYHIILLIVTTLYLGSSKTISPNPSFYFMKQLSEWYTSHF